MCLVVGTILHCVFGLGRAIAVILLGLSPQFYATHFDLFVYVQCYKYLARNGACN